MAFGKSEYTLLLLTLAAVALPLIWAHQTPPLPAFFTQWLASLLWAFVALLATLRRRRNALRCGNSVAAERSVHALATLWALLLATITLHLWAGWTPSFIGLPIAFSLMLAALVTACVLRHRDDSHFLRAWLTALLLGVLLAAIYNAGVALVQTVAPNWTNDNWVASVATGPGGDRAAGNLRQPNQLATLMIWGLLAATLVLRRWPRLWACASLPLLLTVFATGSRAGVMSLALILGVAFTRSRRVRAWPHRGIMWFATVVVVLVLLWFAGNAFTRDTANSALAQRLALWRDVWTLIQQSPWIGVGWGQLNFAWTLTPLPARAPDVFDHAHSLPLHLAAELGVPLATALLALMGFALWFSRRAVRTRDGATASLMLAAILLHSLFEYPLWFAYFLLPSAFLLAWLVAITEPSADASAGQSASRASVPDGVPSLQWKGSQVLMAAVAIFCIAATGYARNEYRTIAAVYRSAADAPALKSAVAEARKSPLYGQFGDYAAIMIAGDAAALNLFARPVHQVLDERLLTAYARALERAGDTARATFIVARAREFPPQAVFAELPVIAPSPAASAPFTPRDFGR